MRDTNKLPTMEFEFGVNWEAILTAKVLITIYRLVRYQNQHPNLAVGSVSLGTDLRTVRNACEAIRLAQGEAPHLTLDHLDTAIDIVENTYDKETRAEADRLKTVGISRNLALPERLHS